MSFKQYLLEFGDLSTLKVDNIELTQNQDGYEYYYDGYRVYMHYFEMSFLTRIGQIPKKYTILNKRNCYTIGLTYKNNYDLTRKGNAFTVYQMVFKAMKKFIEQVDPKGLHISGYIPEMDLLYDRLYNKFLSATFMKVDSEYCIKKSFYETLPEEAKQVIQERMNNSSYKNDLKNIRDNKSGRRFMYMLKKRNQ
jgi:hypothetical protein